MNPFTQIKQLFIDFVKFINEGRKFPSIDEREHKANVRYDEADCNMHEMSCDGCN